MSEVTSKSPLVKVGVCFFLSGLAALLYQVAWMRQLSVVFGTSELAVATVLTAYMSGLSIGAAIAAKYIHKITRPLLVYGFLEGGIAISAVLVPYLLVLGGKAAVFFLGGQLSPPEAAGFGQLLFYFISTLLVLVVPTALMGATLPLLSKYVVETDDQVGSRIGGLYSINTFGAVVGTLFAAFILLPNISLMHTLFVGAALNLVVLLVAINIVNSTQETNINVPVDTSKSEEKPLSFFKTSNVWILPVMTLSGVATFIYEVLWTRLISFILGGSIPAFAVMLAGFLVGIAIGSAIASRYAKTHQGAKLAFVITQVGIASLSAFTYFMIDSSLPEKGGLFANSALAFFLILPSTLFIGATFPLAVRIYANNEFDAPSASAKVYSWNTVGAIVGATFAGYFLIPAVKYSGAIQFAVILNLLLACISVYFHLNFRSLKIWNFAPFVLLLLVVVLYKPTAPISVLNFSPIGASSNKNDDMVYYDVGRSSTVSIINKRTHLRLRNNGLPEAAIPLKGTVRERRPNAWMLSTLPVIARPEAKSMLIAGFGGGVVAENIPPSIESIDILELEPKVIDANKSISGIRALDPLSDSRVNIIFNDARSALQLTDKKYDIVVSQPSHPWTAGASHLYTQEYMQLVENHLTESGVFLQWMNINFVDDYLFKSLNLTLASTFEHVRVYHFSSGDLFFLGSNKALEIERALINKGQSSLLNSDYYDDLGLGSVESILIGLVMDSTSVREFSKSSQIITDNFNILGTRSALALDRKNVLTSSYLEKLTARYSPLYSSESWVYDETTEVNFSYLSKQIGLLESPLLTDKFHQVLAKNKPNHFSAIRVKKLDLPSQKNEAKKQLLASLKVLPNNNQLKYQLLMLHIEEFELVGLSDELTKYYESLPQVAKSVLSNLAYLDLSSIDYKKLESIDHLLQRSDQSDEWYLTAARLRIVWRVRSATVNNDAGQALEALTLINRVLLINTGSDEWSHELRANAAYISGDWSTLKNSLNVLAASFEQTLSYFQKPVNMIDEKHKIDSINKLDRLIAVLSKETATPKEKVRATIMNLKSLKARYIVLEQVNSGI